MITWWFTSFRKECPNGRLSRGHLLELFRKVFPAGNGETFCTHIFRIFDSDGNNFLDFKVQVAACYIAVFFSPPRLRVSITSFVQYHSAICRPIDRTVRRPGPRFESRTGSLERQGHWPLDHPLLFFLQMHTIITGADSYYKCRQLLQMQTAITDADSY